MAIGTPSTGSLTASAAEQSIGGALTAGKTYVCTLDLNTLVNGEVLELYCYVKTLTGSTARLYFVQAFANVQGSPNYQSVPVPAPYSVEFKLKQSAFISAYKVIDWAVFSID